VARPCDQGFRGQHQHRGVHARLGELLADLEAALPEQQDVQHDQRVLPEKSRDQPAFAVARGVHRVAFRPEQLHQAQEQSLFVLDQQNPRVHRFRP